MTSSRNTALRFDPVAHVYRVGGRPVPSVTTVLRHAGCMNGMPDAPEAMARGTRFHRTSVRLDREWAETRDLRAGVPPWVASDLLGPARAYLSFLAALSPVWHLTERPLYHTVLRVAGTPDRIGVTGDGLTIADLKTGAAADWHALQLAGYAYLAGAYYDVPPGLFKRLAVVCGDDGKLRVREYADRGDLDRFRAMLSAYQETERP